MPIATPVHRDSIPEFAGLADLRRRNDGKLLRQVTFTDVIAELERRGELEAVISASGTLKYFRISEPEPERPRLPVLTPFPRVDPLTKARAIEPQHEHTFDTGFNLLRYPPPSQTSGVRFRALASLGAGLGATA